MANLSAGPLWDRRTRAESSPPEVGLAAKRIDTRAGMDRLPEPLPLLPALRALDVLADPTRRQLLWLLRRGPRTVSELCAAAGKRQPLLSKHLRVLREAGLVEAATHAGADRRQRLYDLRREPLAELEAWLADIRADWHQRTRLAPADPDYYKHPDPFANRTTRGTRRKRAPSNRYRDQDGQHIWTDEQLERAWPPETPTRMNNDHER
jgi:DNA-binding transcriptional ArsR family regulator